MVWERGNGTRKLEPNSVTNQWRLEPNSVTKLKKLCSQLKKIKRKILPIVLTFDRYSILTLL